MMQSLLPKVCICIPTYNAELTISETLKSIVNQTYKNTNIFVIDNASTDSTLEIVRRYAAQDSRIKIFEFDKNVGGEGNFTRCMQLAQGEYTAIYHSDDVYEATIVEKEVAFLESHPESGAVFTAATYIDKEGRYKGSYKVPHEMAIKEEYELLYVLKVVLKYMIGFMCPSAMVRTAIYQKEICIWDGNRFATSADLDVWLRILEKHKVGLISEPLMKYRVSTSSFSYRYLRTRTRRHDVFLVLDHYVAKMRHVLDQQDFDNYQYLIFKEEIGRAINQIIREERHDALNVITEAFKSFKWQLFVTRLDYLKVTLMGYITYLLCLFPIGARGARLLYYIRFRE